MQNLEYCDLPAHTLVDLIKSRELSALDVTESALRRIAEVDGSPGALSQPAR